MRRLGLALHVALGCAVWIGPGRARAAELSWSAPGDCATRASAQEQIERLVGRTLAEVDGVDFNVDIARAGAHEWRVTLRTIARRDRAPRTRELTGASCAEVADAAAVAIAMAIEARDEAEPAAEQDGSALAAAQVSPPGSAEPEQEPSASSADPTTSDTPAREDGPRFSLAAGAALDGGSLPELALGVELEFTLGWRALRVTALGAYFPSQETRLSSNTDHGGRFQLALGGLLVCGARAFGPVSAFGCAGFELGRLSAEGLGVHNPRLGGSGWQALRAELGARYDFVTGLGLLARAGIAAPLERREFVLDATDTVHRASAVAVRALLGLELAL